MKRHTRFTSRESPERIAEVMEAAHAQLGGTSERNSFKCARAATPPLCPAYTLLHLSWSQMVDMVDLQPQPRLRLSGYLVQNASPALRVSTL